MLDHYVRFFTVSTSVSAGFIGLLFVALAVVNRDEQELRTHERRTVLAASAFLALVDIFFVSIASSLGGSVLFATTNLVMAMVGLAGTSRLFLRGKRAGNFARGIPQRYLNIAFVGVAAGVFGAQLGLAVALLFDTHSTGLVRALVFVLVALFASALARAWEVAGIGRRSPHEALVTANESQGRTTYPRLRTGTKDEFSERKMSSRVVASRRGSSRSRRNAWPVPLSRVPFHDTTSTTPIA